MNDIFIRLKWISFGILFLNLILSIIGLQLRGEIDELINGDYFYIIINQFLLISIYMTVINMIKIEKISFEKIPNLFSFILFFIFFAASLMVEKSNAYDDYKSFAENKSALPEYLCILYIFAYFTKKWDTSLIDIIFLIFFMVYFAAIGYRFPSLFLAIILLSIVRPVYFLMAGLMFVSIIFLTQFSRIGGEINPFIFSYIVTSNSYDTLYSSKLLLQANNICAYSYDIPLSFIAHVLPFRIHYDYPYYMDNLAQCTPTPGGGLLSAYIIYILNIDPVISFLFIMLFGFLAIFFILRIRNFNILFIIISMIFSFRAFNYGPIAMIKPILIIFLMLMSVRAACSILKSKKSESID